MFCVIIGLVSVLLVKVCVPVSVAKLDGNVFVPEVKSLFVTVCVLVAVRTLDGVMMFDRIAMCYSGCVGAKTKKLMPMFLHLCCYLMCQLGRWKTNYWYWLSKLRREQHLICIAG